MVVVGGAGNKSGRPIGMAGIGSEMGLDRSIMAFDWVSPSSPKAGPELFRSRIKKSRDFGDTGGGGGEGGLGAGRRLITWLEDDSSLDSSWVERIVVLDDPGATFMVLDGITFDDPSRRLDVEAPFSDSPRCAPFFPCLTEQCSWKQQFLVRSCEKLELWVTFIQDMELL